MEKKSYIIGDKVYTQSKMVWGQVRQIIKITDNLTLPSDFTPKDIIKLLEDKIPILAAIILVPEGFTVKNKPMDEMITAFEWDLELDQIMEIIDDFFSFNPIPLWLKKLSTKMGVGESQTNIKRFLEKETGLTETSLSYPEETSLNET